MSSAGGRGSGDTQVLVVGAGPVGLSLAVDLVRHGMAVRVIDTLARYAAEAGQRAH
jgi:2-polyprenyl-6-methoxyphenol hydroxylase-like FAD-dependent oxidoreductase